MGILNLIYRHLKFNENDPDYTCFNGLMKLYNDKELEELDAHVIISMFELHRNIRSLPETLFENGFILPKNDRGIGGDEALWENNKEGTRSLSFKRESWDTMWNRSDHYHIDIEYTTDELQASYSYQRCEHDYGRDKTHEKRCKLILNGKTIIECSKKISCTSFKKESLVLH